MKKILIIFSLLIASCQISEKTKIYKKHKEQCFDYCLEQRFELFHNEESQFLGGASTSSMNGMVQDDIYIKIKAECREKIEKHSCYSNYSFLNFKWDYEINWRSYKE